MKRTILKVGTFVSSMLFAFGLGATEMTYTWRIAIDRYLPGSTTSGIGNGEYVSTYSSAKELVEAKRELIKDVVAEGTVLLKNNNNTLPIAKSTKISLFGRSSTKLIYGPSSGGGKVSCDATLEEVFQSDGVEVNPTLWDYYKSYKGNYRSTGTEGYKTGEIKPSEYSDEVKNSYSSYSDAAIVFICRTFGESHDVPKDPAKVLDGDGVHNALELQDTERAVIEEAKKCSSKVIVVINSDYMMGIDELKHDDKIGAIISVGSLGNTGVYGLCDVITGQVSPSGHLSDTIAANVYSAPAVSNFGDFTFTNSSEIDAKSGTKYVVYQEGIYVGYKYYETRYEDVVLGKGNATSSKGAYVDSSKWDYSKEMSYSFGYGLSYTEFDRQINNVKWDLEKKKVTLNITTKNVGEVEGKDVLQAYVQSPYTSYDITNKVEKAAVSLSNYTKTKTLKPNESVTVNLDLDMDLFASYDSHKAKTYILDYGTYYFAIGNGSHDALNNILAKKGYSTTNGMDYNGDSKQVATYEYAKPSGKEVDDETASTSEYSGVKITNHLDGADINHYGDLLTYLSRNDWAGTWSGEVSLSASKEMVEDMKKSSSYTPSSESSDLSHVVKGVDYDNKSTSYTLKDMNGADYDDPRWDDLLNQLSLDEMSRLVGLANSDAIESINMPAYMEFDGPTGLCATYITDDQEYAVYAAMFPTEVVLSCTFSQELAEEVGEMFGNDGLWTGYHCVWGPGNNIHRTAYLGRNGEYYSEDGILSYYQTKNEVDGAYKFGLSMSPKHFAFNDQEENRGGVCTFFNEQSAREIYLRAFEGALAAGNANSTMCAKNRIGCNYVGADTGLMQDILFDEWKFRGVVIADSASDGYVNGPTIMINGTTQIDTNTTEFINGSLSPSAISSDGVLFKAVKNNCHRNLYLWANTWLAATVQYGGSVKRVTPWYQVTCISIAASMGVITLGLISWQAILRFKSKKKEEK